MKSYSMVSMNFYIWFQAYETIHVNQNNGGQRMKKSTICLLSLMLVGLIISTGLVSAFGPKFMSEEHRLAIKQAIEDNDFEAWKSAIIGTLTQENFDKFVERHRAMSERKELQDAVRQAIEEGDYEAYKEAVENLIGSYKVMSEDNFNAMVERYNAGEGFGPIGGFGCPRRGFGGHRMLW